MKTIRAAILGVTQPHGKGYVDTLQLMPNVEIVAGYDLDTDARATAATILGPDAQIYDTVDQLLIEAKPDAVIITLPPAIVPSVVINCAQHGCHMVVEKPSARTSAEFLPAVEAVEKAGVAFWTGYLRRYSPMSLQIRSLIADGLLGNLHSAEIWHQSQNVRLRGPEKWMFRRDQTGGGMVHWLGVHWIDQLFFLTGGEITEIAAMLDTRSEGIDVEDTAAIMLRFEDRMIASITCSYVLEGTPDQLAIRIHGDKGWIIWQRDAPEFTAHSTDERWRFAPTRTFQFEVESFGGYGGVLGKAHMEAFLSAARGETPVGTGVREALAVLRVLDAIEESGRTGCRVRLEESIES